MTIRKRPIRSLREFLRRIPQLRKEDMTDLHPERPADQCTEIHVNWKAVEKRRQEYFRRYPFWYHLAKLLRRKEVR